MGCERLRSQLMPTIPDIPGPFRFFFYGSSGNRVGKIDGFQRRASTDSHRRNEGCGRPPDRPNFAKQSVSVETSTSSPGCAGSACADVLVAATAQRVIASTAGRTK